MTIRPDLPRPAAWLLATAPTEVLTLWEQAFRSKGFLLAHSPAYAGALDDSRDDGEAWLSTDGHQLGVFLVADGVATSVFPGIPTLPFTTPQGRSVESIATTMLACGVDVVYFPQLYRTAGAMTPTNAVTWPRLPCPVISWHDQGSELWARACDRLGSRAPRRIRRYENSGLHCSTFHGEAAVAAVDRVERHSWKAAARQAMHQRDGQSRLYGSLIRSGHLKVRVAVDGGSPAAFRLDSKVGRRVACLKWSYDERYRSVSPGFFLLTLDLVRTWAGTDTEVIDLFGSPDMLKAAVGTASIERYDAAWPPGRSATELRRERQAHDRRLRQAYETGLGLKRVYAGHQP